MSIILAVGADAQVGDFGGVGASGDLIYIGADEPFWGVYLEFQATNLGGALPFQTLEYSAGSGSWTSITAKDSTVAFTSDGCIALLPSADIYADGSWVKDTVDSSSKYWVRLDPDAALTNVKVSNVYICPYRPPLDATLFPQSGFALASVLPKILVGTWRGETLVWHDVWTLESARVMQLLVGRARGPNSAGQLTLWAICQDDIYHMPIGPESDPARAAWPATSGTGVPHLKGHSGYDFGEVGKVNQVIIEGEFLQADDDFRFYYRWDNDDRWHMSGPHTPFNITIGPLEGQGRVLYTAISLQDATRDAVAPYIIRGLIPAGEWSAVEGAQENLGADIQSPQGQ